MSNSNKNDSKIEDDDEINTKYQPPKVVPIKEIWNQDAEDASLNKYKQQLIGTAINVILGIIIHSHSKPIFLVSNLNKNCVASFLKRAQRSEQADFKKAPLNTR